MEQELRFGLDLGQMANSPAFIASKFSKRSRTGKDVLKQKKYILKQEIIEKK